MQPPPSWGTSPVRTTSTSPAAHATAGPWAGLMDCYADERAITPATVDRVVATGGRHRPATGKGHVPHSLRFEIPFELIGELRPSLMPAMRASGSRFFPAHRSTPTFTTKRFSMRSLLKRSMLESLDPRFRRHRKPHIRPVRSRVAKVLNRR